MSINEEEFFTCVSLILSEKVSIRAVIRWERERNGRSRVATERRLLVDQNDAAMCAIRLAEEVAS